MRLLAVALLLCLSLPAWAAEAPPSVPDHEIRIRVLEERQNMADRRAEAAEQSLRKYAEDQAKSEAGSVEKVAAAQVQGLGGTVSNWLTAIGVIAALAALVGFFNLEKIKSEAKDEARNVAEGEARRAAEAELERMKGELEQDFTDLRRRLSDKGAEALEAVKIKLEGALSDINRHKNRAEKIVNDAEDATKRIQEYLSAGSFSTDGADMMGRVDCNGDAPVVGEVSLPELVDHAMKNLEGGKFDDAVKSAEELGDRLPDDPNVLIFLARTYMKARRFSDAVAMAREAITSAEEAKFKWAEGIAYGDLGCALLELGAVEESKAAFEKDRDIFAEMAERHPSRLSLQRALASAWGLVGHACLQLGDNESALKAFKEELGIIRVVYERKPTKYSSALAASMRNCAKAEIGLGLFDRAASNIASASKIILCVPDVDSFVRRDGAWLTGVEGDLRFAQGECELALQLWGEAVNGLRALENDGSLDFFGSRTLKEYQAKIAAT